MAQLIQSDAISGMRKLPVGSVDLIITSPPYGIGTDYGEFKDDKPREEYLYWTDEWAAVASWVLRTEGSLFLNISGKPTDPWIPFDVAQVFKNYFKLQNVIHWIKSIAIEDRTYGHYKPINSHRFLNDAHEFIFHFTQLGNVPLQRTAIGVPYTDSTNLMRWEGAGRDKKHCRGNAWFLPYQTRQAKGIHPATFPVELPEYCAKLHGVTPATVLLDPFMGTGATALASVKLGTEFIGFDINEEYLMEARRRIDELEGN